MLAIDNGVRISPKRRAIVGAVGEISFSGNGSSAKDSGVKEVVFASKWAS